MSEKEEKILREAGELIRAAGYSVASGLHIKFSCFADDCGVNCSNGCNQGCSSCSQGCTTCSSGKSNPKLSSFHFQPTFQVQGIDMLEDLATLMKIKQPVEGKK